MICTESTKITENTKKLLTFSKVTRIGPVALHDIAKLNFFESMDVDGIRNALKILNKYPSINDKSLLEAEKKAKFDIEQASSNNCRIISFLDNEYPALLKQCGKLAPILFVKGKWHDVEDKYIAIIGTREPTIHGKEITKRISNYFIGQNWSIVSGLAIGCDTIAHKQAVENNKHTVAVLSHGLQTIAPKQNRLLAKKILDCGGILVTEYGFGIESKPYQFVARDKIQAALSKAVVMIQSDLKGGSLHASRASVKFGRLLAVPYPTEPDIESKNSKIQTNLLLADGDLKNKTSLLECDINNLNQLFIIKHKNDYPILENRLNSNSLKSE